MPQVARIAARIAVALCEHDARDADALFERLRDVDGLLAGHGVYGKERRVYRNRFLDLLELMHHLLVDLETASRIDEDRIEMILRRVIHAGFCDLFRLPVFSEREYFDTDFLTVDDQLFDRRRTVNVRRDKKHLPSLRLQFPGEFCRGRRLAGALQADHHEDGHVGRLLERQFGDRSAKERYHLVVDDLDDHLRRI